MNLRNSGGKLRTNKDVIFQPVRDAVDATKHFGCCADHPGIRNQAPTSMLSGCMLTDHVVHADHVVYDVHVAHGVNVVCQG